ncbi:Rho termination factor N-terminal domain-containing protein [Clostridium sporogenes]|uniref:Rho termination factor N-terminal domain-containing protein n=1 Tax=Clostridium sporogenes TaxID=1509 RepID=UPI0015EFB63E|nr:Rho termination factor N-terminal domain-containing protein [Clostridium sporogenes]MBA4507939.1 Rho termination factor N-terminal domain-containing protein [Clostridium sporogenes]MCW6105649.1 Rho termination factor N-terminal domain-containing protein [Clostridium sporogenes]
MGLSTFNRMRRQLEEKKNKISLEDMTIKELKEECKRLELEDYKNLKKEELIELLRGVLND